MKKLLALLAAFTIVFAVVGCSAEEENADKDNGAAEENTAELTDQAKSKMYNSIRVAEGKVNEVFAKETVSAEDPTFVINSSFADEASAVEFLSKYYNEDTAKEIYAHYATEEKTDDGRMIVNQESYFPASILTTTQEDVTVEGDANKGTVTAPEDVVYTVELAEGKYIITGVEK
ncbi:endonuclease [Mesobacillus harenae]|uniref:endonuclease n=1 Tax=Mesobacillus harenae TaxID=2213203 RepID=UPI0015812095|nr:endonuclease [Mesobacillus harenae]